MPLLYRKILIDDLIDRGKGTLNQSVSYNITNSKCEPDSVFNLESKYTPNLNYGKVKADYIYFTIPIHQKHSGIGIYLQEPFIPNDTIIDEAPDPIVRKKGVPLQNYLTTDNYQIYGQTSSRLNEIDFYGDLKLNFNYADDINSYTGIFQKNNQTITYVINGENNGGYVSNTGIRYVESFVEKRIIYDRKTKSFIQIPVVNFSAKGQGWTAENVVLEEIVKDDKLMGITLVTEIQNDLSIDRSEYSVFEHHYILGEVKTMTDLSSYRNNYFKLQQ